jgi:hypothetical protein
MASMRVQCKGTLLSVMILLVSLFPLPSYAGDRALEVLVIDGTKSKTEQSEKIYNVVFRNVDKRSCTPYPSCKKTVGWPDREMYVYTTGTLKSKVKKWLESKDYAKKYGKRCKQFFEWLGNPINAESALKTMFANGGWVDGVIFFEYRVEQHSVVLTSYGPKGELRKTGSLNVTDQGLISNQDLTTLLDQMILQIWGLMNP